MIPILYETTETAFTSAGLGFLADAQNCVVSEELNGTFELELAYPMTGPLFKELKEHRIIFATNDDTKKPQPFEIYSHSAPINGLVTFYAHHISYRLTNAVVGPFTGVSCSAAFSALRSSSMTGESFTYYTNISDNHSFGVNVPTAIRPLIGGEENSFLKKYGGELEFDKFKVSLLSHRGSITNVEIRFGKNLSNIEDKIDADAAYNAIVPYWNKSDGTDLVTLNSGYVYHDDGTGIIKAVPMSFRSYFSTKPTKAALKTKAQEVLDDSYSWIPDEEVTVDFVQLWQTEEYKDFAPLQRVVLGDTVKVIYPELNIDIQERVVKTVYNTLLDRYNEVTLNQLPDTLAGITTEQINSSTATIDSSLALAVALIRGELGGYIVTPADSNGLPQKIYVLDTPDIDNATKVFKLDQDGLSYSSTGASGTFTSLINMNGEHVTINGASIVKLGAGAVKVLLSGSVLGQMLAASIGGENVTAIKATNPFVLADSSGVLGYRYGGSAGNGSYNAPHYFSGDVIIDGDLTVTGTLSHN